MAESMDGPKKIGVDNLSDYWMDGLKVERCPRCNDLALKSEHRLFMEDAAAYKCWKCGVFGYKDGRWWELNA